MSNELIIELESFDTGVLYRIHGPGHGDRGVFLGQHPEGIYDEPTESIWNSHAFQIGASFGGIRIHKRDVILGMEITDTPDATWQDNDSDWRLAWDYKKDSKLWIETNDSRRWLSLKMSEDPKFAPDTDPFQAQYGHIIYTAVAGNPRWYEKDYTDQWINSTDTTNGAWAPDGFVKAWNPTNTTAWMIWTVQAYPGAVYKLPDFSFGNDKEERAVEDAARKIVMPALIAGEHLVVNTDDEDDQVTSNIDTQVWQRMEGVTFCYPLEPYFGTRRHRTYKQPVNLPVTVKNAPAGVGVQLRIRRGFTRPWGLR